MPKTTLETPRRLKRGHLPTPEIEWIGVPHALRQFGLGKTLLYAVLKDPHVESVLLKRKGAARGKRLINANSLRKFLANQPAN